MSELEKLIHHHFSVSLEDAVLIASFFKIVKLKKGEFFLKSGKNSERLGFIESGMLREFANINDKEITKWISTKGYFVVDLGSFLFETTSTWNFVALSDCILYIIDKEQYQNISTVIPSWITLEKLFIAKCFSILEDRIVTHLAMTAEERYLRLLEFSPELFISVPLQYLASMLGMSPETLSRLRNKRIP